MDRPTLTELALKRLGVNPDDVRELAADLLTVAKIARREPLTVLRALLEGRR